MCNLIEQSDNYSKTPNFIDFNEAKATTNSKIKEQIADQTGNNGTKNAEKMEPLKYPSNFCRTLEMPLINCKINLYLNWSKKCIIVASDINQETTFSITNTKLCVPIVTLSTQDNAKLFEQLKSDFKRKINRNKYQSKILTEISNQSLNYLIDPSFQGVSRLFVLSIENNAHRTSDK